MNQPVFDTTKTPSNNLNPSNAIASNPNTNTVSSSVVNSTVKTDQRVVDVFAKNEEELTIKELRSLLRKRVSSTEYWFGLTALREKARKNSK